jgi:hypothetical protein
MIFQENNILHIIKEIAHNEHEKYKAISECFGKIFQVDLGNIYGDKPHHQNGKCLCDDGGSGGGVKKIKSELQTQWRDYNVIQVTSQKMLNYFSVIKPVMYKSVIYITSVHGIYFVYFNF